MPVGLIAALGSFLVQILNSSVAKWIAEKALWTFFFIVVLPIILNNWAYDIIEIGLQLIGDTGSSGFSGTQSFTGLTAYFLHHLKIPECLSVLMGALMVKTYLRIIPLIRWS